jgi:predicted MFS family arabinose efflux permease
VTGRPSSAAAASGSTLGGSLWRQAALRRLAGLSALGFGSFSLTIAAVPSYAVRSGASSAEAGLTTAAMLASTVAVQTAVPALDRRWGTPRLLAAGLIAIGAPAPAYLVSDRLGWLVAVSAVRGIGFAIVTVLGALLSVREAPPGRQGEAVGIYGLSISGTNLFAVPAGTVLTSYGHFGVVAILAACPLLALPFTRGVHRGFPPDADHPRHRTITTARTVAVPSLVLLVVTLSGAGLVTFLPIVRPHGSLASIALLVYGLPAAGFRWQAGKLADRIGVRTLLPAGLGTAVIGMVLVAAALLAGHSGAGETVLLMAGAAIFGCGYGATQNLTLVVAFAHAGPSNTAAASAIWNGAFDAGTAIGAYGVGLVAVTSLELPGSYLLCAALTAVAIPAAIATTSSRSGPRRAATRG